MVATGHARRGTAGLLLAVVLSAPALAAVPATHDVTVPWSTGGIQGIAIAPDGAVWAAGQLGLFRFDGRDLTTYDARNAPALAGAGQLVRVAVDVEGAAWVTAGGGMPLVRADGRVDTEGVPQPGVRRLWNGQWSVLGAADGIGDGRAYALLAHDGAMWIGTTTGVTVVRGGRATTFGAGAGVPAGPVTVLAAAGDGAVLAGGAAGLCRLAGGRCQRLLDEPVLSAVHGSPRRVWAGTPRGVVVIDDGKVAQRLGPADGLPDAQVRALALDRDGALWVATYAGLGRMRDGRAQWFDARDGLPEAQLTALAIDGEGGVWAGTRTAGIARVARAAVATVGTEAGLPDERVRSVAPDGRGGIWMLTSGGVARWTAGAVSTWRRGRELPDADPRTMAPATDGGLWIGTAGAGVVHLAADGKAKEARGDGLADDATVLLADRDGGLWTSSRPGALEHWTPDGAGRLRLVGRHAVPPPCRGNPYGGYQGPSGTRYFLPRASGLVRVGSAGVECLPGPFGLRHQPVTSVWEDAGDDLWLGASFDGGLVRLRGGRPVRFDEASGLPCDSITAIAPDGRGHLWLGCAVGVARVALDQLDAVAQGRLARVAPVRFDPATGLGRPEAGPWHGALAAVAADGALWIATGRGASVIQPPELIGVPAPAVSIHTVVLDGRARTRPFEASAAAADLELRYRAVAFTFPAAIRFRHRLVGAEQGWNETAAEVATYRRLPPGRYTFEVQSANAFGAWGSAVVSAPIFVRRPWHRSPWSAFAAAAGLGALALVAHRLRLQRVQARFRLVQGERERMARDLHDGLGQGFASIGFHLDALAEHVRGQPRADALLEKARVVLDECREEARRAIWALRDDVLQGRSLDDALKEVARRAEGAPVVEVIVTGQPRRRDGFLDHELYRIATELITNARRHAGAARVVVELEWGDDAVVLRVKDDGRGLGGDATEHAARGHFGLLGIRERARRLGGDVTVMSGAGVGTEVRVAAPVAARRTT